MEFETTNWDYQLYCCFYNRLMDLRISCCWRRKRHMAWI